MDWMNTLALVCTIAVMILSCFTAYINFQTMRLIKETREIQEGKRSQKNRLVDGKKGKMIQDEHE